MPGVPLMRMSREKFFFMLISDFRSLTMISFFDLTTIPSFLCAHALLISFGLSNDEGHMIYNTLVDKLIIQLRLLVYHHFVSTIIPHPFVWSIVVSPFPTPIPLPIYVMFAMTHYLALNY